jgi:hypothetical protein
VAEAVRAAVHLADRSIGAAVHRARR